MQISLLRLIANFLTRSLKTQQSIIAYIVVCFDFQHTPVPVCTSSSPSPLSFKLRPADLTNRPLRKEIDPIATPPNHLLITQHAPHTLHTSFPEHLDISQNQPQPALFDYSSQLRIRTHYLLPTPVAHDLSTSRWEALYSNGTWYHSVSLRISQSFAPPGCDCAPVLLVAAV